MEKANTKILVVPQWQAGLFISLFYADGGGGYSKNEINEVEQIINKERLTSLVSVSDPRDGECSLEFIVKPSKEESKAMTENNIYTEKGYTDRNGYLDCLADDYGIYRHIVNSITEILGEDEDFDGLVSALEDFSLM